MVHARATTIPRRATLSALLAAAAAAASAPRPAAARDFQAALAE